MRKYNIQNYIRYKEDLKEALKLLPDYGDDYEKYTRKELITKFLPLVRRFFNLDILSVSLMHKPVNENFLSFSFFKSPPRAILFKP